MTEADLIPQIWRFRNVIGDSFEVATWLSIQMEEVWLGRSDFLNGGFPGMLLMEPKMPMKIKINAFLGCKIMEFPKKLDARNEGAILR